MKFKTFKNKAQLLDFKQHENIIKIQKFLYVFLLNNLQFKNYKLFNKKEIIKIQIQQIYLKRLLPSISKTKLYRNCIMTQRSRAVYRPYGLSRCALKHLISQGRLPGYTKFIW